MNTQSVEKKQSLDAKRANMFMFDPANLTIVGLDTTDGPEHPLYDERINLPLDEAMVKNVMALGILEPVGVRKNGDKVEVVFGRQRVRWAREANARFAKDGRQAMNVPVVVRRGDDSEHLGVLISENEVRQDDGPLQKARKAQKYTALGKTNDEAATAFGVTGQCVRNWLALIDLDGAVQKAVENGTISASAASKFAGLDREAQKRALAELEAQPKPTGKKAAKAAKANTNDDVPQGVSRGRIRKILAQVKADKIELPEQVQIVLEWMVGEKSDRSLINAIAEMGAILKQV